MFNLIFTFCLDHVIEFNTVEFDSILYFASEDSISDINCSLYS